MTAREITRLPFELDLKGRIGHWLGSKPALAIRPFDESEQSLLDGLRAADSSAIDRAYRAHQHALRGFAFRLLGDEAAAEDLVHDVFVALPRAVQNFRGESSLRTFLLAIGARLSRRHIRSASRRRAMLARLERAQPSPGPADDTRRQMEQARALATALEALPLAQRTAFVLCEVEQRSAAEVAAILDVPEATVRTRCFHARKKLRELLEGVVR